MSQLIRLWMMLALGILGLANELLAQAPEKLNPEDARYKADILVVVAHPDDEGFFTPYLAREIYDAHKRVAVIFSTHGGSGVNRFTRERGPAMANEREIEARDACARLGISNVWFLDGKDTPSQNLMDSLSNWGHGENLERLVGLIRLTRPDVILTHFPGVFIGENHGDHQATGVLTIEAFDLAGDPLVFPSQLAGPTNHYESYLSNLQVWQAKKIYFGSDANDNQQFDGSGPAYSVRQISPSQNKPYWRLALYSAMAHRTQFPADIDRLSKMTDTELEQTMNDPDKGWWSEPLTLIFGKSVVDGKPTDDVFRNIDEKPNKELLYHSGSVEAEKGGSANPRMELGGPWKFYNQFRPAHGLTHLTVAKVPEIAIKSGTTLSVPLVVWHDPSKPLALNVTAKLPERWKVSAGSGTFEVPEEASTTIEVLIETPKLTDEELKNAKPEEVIVHGESTGQSIGELKLRVLLRKSALPQ